MSLGYHLLNAADLAPHNTLHLPARAQVLARLEQIAALPQLLADPAIAGRPLLVLGHGSNVLFAGDPDAVVVTIAANAWSRLDGQRVRAEAGLAWDDLVSATLAAQLPGLENLALIPGTVGAAPIQNIGAYGLEVGERIHAVEVWDRTHNTWRQLAREDCVFGYRDSVFKHEPERFIITAVEFNLPAQAPLRLDYAGLASELTAMGITTPSAQDVAAAVRAQRRRKLPDPAKLGNLGSFFKNPIIARDHASALQAAHPSLPMWPVGTTQTKLSAAWLIEQCGWKGHRAGDAGVYDGHALVLVNHGAATGADILALARAIAASVQARFGVVIEPEPRMVGARW